MSAPLPPAAPDPAKWVAAWLAPLRADPPPALPPDPDFIRRVVAFCQEHRLVGLLRAALRLDGGLNSSDLLRWLDIPYRLEAERLSAAAAQAAQVIAGMNAAGVPVLVMKGWALIASLYAGDPALRPTADLDLLIHSSDEPKAQAVLAGLGYAPHVPAPWPGFYWRFQGRIIFVAAGRLDVGLRCQPLPLVVPSAPLVAEWFERSLPFDLSGVPARTLAAADNLVYLCAHLALHHQYEALLFRYVDLARLIEHSGGNLDWSAVNARAGAWRLVLPLRRALGRLDELWPGLLPSSEISALAQLPVQPAERRLHAWAAERPQTTRSDLWVTLLALENWRERLAYLAQSAAPSPAYVRWRYNRRSAWAAYLARLKSALHG